MIHKEKIPITFFEKAKAAIEVFSTSFFLQATPDVPSLIKALNLTPSEKLPKTKQSLRLLERQRDALNFLSITRREYLTKQINALHHVVALTENGMTEEGGIKFKGKEAIDYLDSFYLSDSPVNLVDDKLSVSYDKRAETIERTYWMLHRFNRFGKKTFRIEEQLTNELFITDVGNVDSDFLQFPFPSICFYLPFNTKLCIRKELIEYVYISERVVVGKENDNCRIVECLYVTKSNYTDIHSFYIREGKLLEQIEKQFQEKYSSQLGIKESTEIMSFVLAATLYLNSQDVDKKDIFPIVFQTKTDSRFPVCSLGYNIKIDKGLHYSQNPDTAGLGNAKNVLKWTVRGHFRTYRKGEHWKEDRTIWIRPFLKGRERDNPEQIMKPTNYLVE